MTLFQCSLLLQSRKLSTVMNHHLSANHITTIWFTGSKDCPKTSPKHQPPMCIFDYTCTSFTQFKAQIYKWEDIIKERLCNHINADDLTKLVAEGTEKCLQYIGYFRSRGLHCGEIIWMPGACPRGLSCSTNGRGSFSIREL